MTAETRANARRRDRQLSAMVQPLLEFGSIDHLRWVERWDRLHVAVSVLAVDN